ncbi:unnamed protein product [Blepharisma stoltei]|uniref:NADH dehydrogenase subunit 9 n=1 Tax=Blepharisma stoltei TaxID=1481888 RepID=A0AAU9K3Y3_9CILI|nr:unnamed protein product [Blepharisma stoltei]
MARFVRLFSTIKSKPISIYESPDYAKLASIKGNFVREAISVLGQKYHQFVPFYLESRLTTIQKRFVVKMDLLPEENKIEITSLQLGQLDAFKVPIEQVVPVTPQEYTFNHSFGKVLKHAEFMDLEMVYLIRKQQEFLVFDKEGTWNQEGVNHPSLSMEKNYKEHAWMDFTCSPRADINGGNIYNNY